MNVLHINTNKNWRGGEQQVNYLFNHSSPITKYLFCPADSELTKKNISSGRAFSFKKRLGFDLFAALQLKKVSRKQHIDLIHLHDSHAINLYLLANLFGMNIPAVIHRHVNFPVRSKWKYDHKKIQKIICVSEEVQKKFSWMPENKLTIIHPAIDIKKFLKGTGGNYLHKELNIDSFKKIVGIVASLEKEKNVAEFVSIANTVLKTENVVFVIIGNGSERHKFEHLKLNINNHIGLLGYRSDIPELLSSFDLFLFTSKEEGFPLVLLEAMAAGVPILTTGAGGIQNMITNNENGIIYQQGNIDEAATKTKTLLDDENLRSTLIQNAFQYVQRFDVPLMAEKVEALYKDVKP